MRYLKFYNIIIIILFAFFNISCGVNPIFVHTEAEWNYLIYMAADNNLERFAIQNIKELQKVGSNAKVNFLILLDRSQKYKEGDDWSGTKLLYISKNSRNFDDDVILSYDELDMTDSENLYNFLTFANEYFPSKHTALNIWSHGSGVSPDGKIPGLVSKSIIQDTTTGYDKSMAIVELKEAISRYENEANKKIEILHFDACDMQMLEVAYELKNTVDYIVGSETQMPSYGSAYEAIATFLTNNPYARAKEVGTYITDFSYEKYKENSRAVFSLSGKTLALSTIETATLSEFVTELNKISDSLLTLSEVDIEAFLQKRSEFSVVTEYSEFCDLKEFLTFLGTFGIEVSSALTLLDKVVVNSYALGNNATLCGISVNIPYMKSDFSKYADAENQYSLLQIYTDTSFPRFLARLNECLNGKNDP